jgi:anti-sigma B factor antagonist
MKATAEELDGGITRVCLEGRMDIAGAQAVDLKMNVIAGSAHRLLLDMAGVSFLSSMGLRSIVVPAKAISRRGGKMVLYAPSPSVKEVLDLANVGAIIPIYHDLDAAMAALQ